MSSTFSLTTLRTEIFFSPSGVISRSFGITKPRFFCFAGSKKLLPAAVNTKRQHALMLS